MKVNTELWHVMLNRGSYFVIRERMGEFSLVCDCGGTEEGLGLARLIAMVPSMAAYIAYSAGFSNGFLSRIKDDGTLRFDEMSQEILTELEAALEAAR